MGIPSIFVAWFENFLTDRRYTERVGNAYAKQRRFFGGLPQGTVSGPILWIIYISALRRKCTKCRRDCHTDGRQALGQRHGNF